MSPERITAIAVVCHQATKAWCELNGDTSIKNWNEAHDWQRDGCIAGVKFRLENPDSGIDASHNAWMAGKEADGWSYGEIKDADKKTHPCMVPYGQLPEYQRKNDAVFCGVIDALK